MSSRESHAEFLTGYVPVAFPIMGWLGGTMVGAFNFDRAEPYQADIDQLSTANSSLSEVQSALSDNPEAQQVIGSRITQNKDQIASLTTTVDHYHSRGDMFETMGIGAGSGVLAAVLVVGGIKLWAKNHHDKPNTDTPKTS